MGPQEVVSQEELNDAVSMGRNFDEEVYYEMNRLLQSPKSVKEQFVLIDFGGLLEYIGMGWIFLREPTGGLIWKLYMAMHEEVECKLNDLEGSEEVENLVQKWAPEKSGGVWPHIETAPGYHDTVKDAKAAGLAEKKAKQSTMAEAVKALSY